MNIQENPILCWLKEIEQLQEAGHTICPLMTAQPARFPAHVCACDIPKTRERFFIEGPGEYLCTVGAQCLPRASLPDDAQEETRPKPSPRIKRPRGAWTASFRK